MHTHTHTQTHAHTHEEGAPGMGTSTATATATATGIRHKTSTRTSSRDTSSRPSSGLSMKSSGVRDGRRFTTRTPNTPGTPDLTDLELYPELKAVARKVSALKHTPWVEGKECMACEAERLRKTQRKTKDGSYSRGSRERYTSAYRKKAVV
ncbi:hypothetical protein SARC_08998 [Sphaeroforma arctica JP610]|uniref:Uncharacterized protein n=1 Tax=Sphaeroforma arctica JP610 TaxID=667725 RepID=A0A0L0FQ04_9EUKA|nr:hypothetical protein SARC_08998 [Sphaeroforma arctica JP610]KNC78581.1 hypothetical protein SARC_08998 [Sphaeroforma arctica JP610]|eukprot:XP_014152483.1 hypothetical protein SARC_08998 [Sphaeroforma arctica JP610]